MSEDFDYEATVAKIHELQQGNIEKVRALQAAGKAIDPGAVANVKIDTFIELFLDQNAKAAYVLRMEESLRESLDESLAAVRQQQIVEGVGNAKGGLILPNKG